MDIKIINKSGFETPRHETELSAGMDLKSTADMVFGSMERRIVPTGIYIELPEGFEAQIRPRSGLAIKKGLTVLNAPGTIDADYRGEVGVIIVNLSNETVRIERGERIAQMVIAKHERVTLIPVLKLGSTERGAGGFGSTGTK